MLELTLRLVFSLAVVLGLLLLIARISSKRFKGSNDSLVRVLHRQPLSRNNAVYVVAVGSRVLVLGATEHQVGVLAELDPEEVEEPDILTDLGVPPRPKALPGAHRADVPVITSQRPDRGGTGGFSGSILSPATWRQAKAAASRRAS